MIIAFSLVNFLSTYTLAPSLAQAPVELECGKTIESVFTEDQQIHHYVINANSDMSLKIYAEAQIGDYETLTLDVGLWAPNGFEINRLQFERGQTNTILTGWLSVDGLYKISTQGWTNTGGAYALTVNCLYTDGTLVTGTNVVQSLKCASIVENTFARDQETHRYYIVLNENDKVKFTATALTGNYETLNLDIGLWAPNGFEIDTVQFSRAPTSTIETSELSVSGIYSLAAQGWTSTTGDYELTVTCTLADGTVVNPGDVPPISLTETDNSVPEVVPESDFSGFGFPGLAPVDFTNIAQLPLPVGVPMSGAITPNGGEIIGYQFEGNAGDSVDLSFARLSGNLNVGLVVIDSDSNVIYQASLVNTTTMSAQFTLPISGQYTVGIFRISLLPPDNPEATAFQVSVTTNE